MDGRIPLAGGWRVRAGGRDGIVYDQAPEAAALQRWQKGAFEEIERIFAHNWREALRATKLDGLVAFLRSVGFDGNRLKSFDELWARATQVVHGFNKRFELLKIAVDLFDAPPQTHARIIERWQAEGEPSLDVFAPYAAFVLSVEIFFQFSLAAGLISASRPSNRGDIAYLFYLPFARMFVSSDNLHRRCAPALMRRDQIFVWGPDLKADLARLNDHYLALPLEIRQKGVMSFAHCPPKEGSFLI